MRARRRRKDRINDMEEFRFRDRTFNISVNGEVFTAPVNDRVSFLLSEIADELDCAAASLESGDEGSREQACELLAASIDRLLGCGAAERIFSARGYDFYELCEVLVYVCDCYTEFNLARLEHFRSCLEGNTDTFGTVKMKELNVK